MGKVLAVGPHEAIVVTRKREKKIITGGWVFADYLCYVQRLSLNVYTLNPSCSDVETIEGVRVNVSAIAQCKVKNTPHHILTATEQFLGRQAKQASLAICLTLEGHLRSILGTLTVEEAYKDRVKFAQLVREVAATDIEKMGIQIISFVIKDIHDDVGYLASLGKARIAEVKRDATIGTANANRDAGIKEAECERQAKEKICQIQTNIENYSMSYNVKQSEYDTEINRVQAEAALAYELKIAQIRQLLRYEEICINIIEKKKEIEIQEKEILCKEQKMVAEIKLPSEAESYRIQMIAEGNKVSKISEAVGESERIKKVGEAEAYMSQAVGIKEAERMKKRALVLQAYGDAAIKQTIIQKLPEITSQVCAPLSKIDELIILGGDNNDLMTSLTKLAGQIPPVLHALNVVNLKKDFK